jgi:hypothetical protein
MRLFTFTIPIIPLRSRACRRAPVALIGLLFYAGWCLNAGAQPNSWTDSVSGYWEDPDWSLGALPGTNQTILFTNAGWKALGITANTAQNYPQTLWVDSVTISSPTNSFNTLLLNYAGFVTPLAAKSLTVASNSAVVMASSALQVAGNISVGGTFTEIEGSQVSVGSLHLGDLGPAVYNLTNSTLSTLEEHIGGFPATLNQQGGTNTGSLYLESSGQYNLFGGSVGGWIGLQGGGFSQWDGNVSAGIRFTSGAYHLAGGTLSSDGLQIPGPPQATGSEARGSFHQTGGTNFTSGISLGY